MIMSAGGSGISMTVMPTSTTITPTTTATITTTTTITTTITITTGTRGMARGAWRTFRLRSGRFRRRLWCWLRRRFI